MRLVRRAGEREEAAVAAGRAREEPREEAGRLRPPPRPLVAHMRSGKREAVRGGAVSEGWGGGGKDEAEKGRGWKEEGTRLKREQVAREW
ncbi:hypothetical protein AB1Y20_013913 [Prymnesium parvum]|uniref:Uncharacterized protein n=1 Tax=Prymnesium parvum TaxID=97485 RepID=A0AB34IHP7_PRYPA